MPNPFPDPDTIHLAKPAELSEVEKLRKEAAAWRCSALEAVDQRESLRMIHERLREELKQVRAKVAEPEAVARSHALNGELMAINIVSRLCLCGAFGSTLSKSDFAKYEWIVRSSLESKSEWDNLSGHMIPKE